MAVAVNASVAAWFLGGAGPRAAGVASQPGVVGLCDTPKAGGPALALGALGVILYSIVGALRSVVGIRAPRTVRAGCGDGGSACIRAAPASGWR